jgi:hypothetical protein
MPINTCKHPEKPSKTQNMTKKKLIIKLCEICSNNKDLNQSENDNKETVTEFRRSRNRENHKRHRSMLYLVNKEATRGREFGREAENGREVNGR